MADDNDGDRTSNTADASNEEEMKILLSEQEKLAQQMQEEVKGELTSHIAQLEQEMKDAFNQRLTAMAEQCTHQVAEAKSSQQIDILRTSKIFRDISRPLGTNWRSVFDLLMSRFPREVADAEKQKIEQDRPVLQPYKALMVWKDVCGPDFNIHDLIEALHQTGFDDLAQTAEQILNSKEMNSLIELSGFGKNQPVGAGRLKTAADSKLQPTAAAAAAAAGSSESTAKGSVSSNKVNAEEVLDDRHLLLLAKRLGANWEPVAASLQVPDDELADILSAEGKTYQGAFKMLWSWRESCPSLTQGLESLTTALRQLGHQELIDQVLQ